MALTERDIRVMLEAQVRGLYRPMLSEPVLDTLDRALAKRQYALQSNLYRSMSDCYCAVCDQFAKLESVHLHSHWQTPPELSPGQVARDELERVIRDTTGDVLDLILAAEHVAEVEAVPSGHSSIERVK